MKKFISATIAISLMAAFSIVSVHAQTAITSENKNAEHADSNQNDTKNQQRGSEKAPFVVEIGNAPQAQQKPEADASQQNNGWFYGWSVGDKIALVVAIIAFLQFWALMATYRIMDSSAKRELRAYVLLQQVEFARPKTKNGDNRPWAVHIEIRNSGKTPAYKMVVKAEAQIGVAPKADDIVLSLSSAAQIFPETILAADDFQTVRLNKGLENGLADFFKHRGQNQRAYVWGRIDYIDTFGRKHWVTFQNVCHFGQSPQFAYCDRGNGTDDSFAPWWRFWQKAQNAA